MAPQIRLIGRPEIRIDETTSSVRGHKPWALMARVLMADRALPRRQVAAELFPEADDPLGSLRWCLAALRKALGSADCLTGDPIDLALPPGTWVDVWELADGRLDGIDVEGGLLDEVDPQAGPELDCWLLVERQRIASLVDARLRQEVIEATASGDHDRAIARSRLAVARLPYDESAWILLVSSVAAAGRTEEAAEHLAAAEALLRTELGVEPSPALRSAARRSVAEPPEGITPTAIARSLLDAGRAALTAGAADAGVDCLRRAVAEAERTRDRQLQAEALLELGTGLVHAVRGFDDEGAVYLRRAADHAKELGDPRIGAVALRELGYVDALAGRRPTAAAYLSDALPLAGDDGELLAGVHAVTAFNLTDWGRTDDGLGHFETSIELASAADHPRQLGWSLGMGGWARLRAGDRSGAREWLAGCLDVVGSERWLAFRPWPLAVLGELDLLEGRPPATVREHQTATFALSSQLGDPCWEGVSARTMALACSAGGEHPEALRWIADARSRCRRHTDVFVGIEAWIVATECRVAAAADRPELAEASARRLLAIAARAHMDGLVREATQLLGLGDDL